MKCDQTREWLPGLLDRTVDEAREVLLRQHLAECDECAREMDEMSHTWSILESMERAEPPAWFHESLMAQIAVSQENRARRDQAWWRQLLMPNSPGRWAATATAAALVLMTFFSVYLNGTQGTVQGGLDGIRNLFGLHRSAPTLQPSPLPAVQTPRMAAEPSLTPAVFYNRQPTPALNGPLGLTDSQEYHTLSLRASGTAIAAKVQIRLLYMGAVSNPTETADAGRTVWEGSLEPGQSLYIPIRAAGDIKEGATPTFIAEIEGGHRYLLYMPVGSRKISQPDGTVSLAADTSLREAIRQASEAMSTPFWVDARLTGRVHQTMSGVSALGALEDVLKNTGASLEKEDNLYCIRVRS